MTNLRVAGTIIHQASHKFCDTRDFAYSYDPGYGTLTSTQAVMNAEVGFAEAALRRAARASRVPTATPQTS